MGIFQSKVQQAQREREEQRNLVTGVLRQDLNPWMQALNELRQLETDLATEREHIELAPPENVEAALSRYAEIDRMLGSFSALYRSWDRRRQEVQSRARSLG